MTWIDRLQPEILLVSPSGQEFTAMWRGDARTKEKRLGVFEFPKIPGALVQRLGSGPTRYPLTFSFEGPDNDLIASSFFAACDDDTGNWTINHPTLGLMKLDLVSVTEQIQPLDSGNVTVIESEWIEPMDGGALPTVPQIASEIQNQIEVVKSQAIEQFVVVTEPTLLEKLVAFKNKAMDIANTVMSTVNSVKRTVAGVRSQIETVYRAIINTLQATVLEITSLGGEIQVLIDLPGQMTDDISSRINFYTELIENAFDGESDVVDAPLREIVVTSAVIGVVRTVVDADLTSREDALAYLDTIGDVFIDATNRLDAEQTLYSGLPIDRQYFSQSQSFTDLAILVTLATRLLLTRSYDLAVAKRFTLKRDRAPIEIAITEGVDLDQFIATNHLKNDDILLLPAGREVVVYL